MNKQYTITGLTLNTTTGDVTVTLTENGPTPTPLFIVLPTGSPLIATLTIGRIVNAVYTLVP